MKSWAALAASGQNDPGGWRVHCVVPVVFGGLEKVPTWQEGCQHRHAAHLPFPAWLVQLHKNKKLYISWEHLKDISHLFKRVL